MQKTVGMPANKKELKTLENPFDYLAKYCLIQSVDLDINIHDDLNIHTFDVCLALDYILS